MWAIVGLGNPGRKYAGTRHNAGFMALDLIAERLGATFSEAPDFMLAHARLRRNIHPEEMLLVKPLTYMNRSGIAVAALSKRHGFRPPELIVLQDDMDMDVGRLKIRQGGSSGGHKGVESIIASLGTKQFIRVKVGVGRDPLVPTEKFVLSGFASSEVPLMEDAIHQAADAVDDIVLNGLSHAMNLFNRRQEDGPEDTAQ